MGDNTRAAVYGGLAATVLFPPLAIAAYATAAGVLESKIKRHEDALARLFQKCDKSANAARNLISETRKTKSFFETEQVLIQAWESKMSDMAVDFKDADEVVENVELFGSDEMDRMLNALITACANYRDTECKTKLSQALVWGSSLFQYHLLCLDILCFLMLYNVHFSQHHFNAVCIHDLI